MKTALLVAITALLLSGCCTYKGKMVSKKTAADMRAQGMDVQCP